MRRRVPDAVAQRLARVPVEPPVHHLAADGRHRRAHGDVADAVGQRAPAGLDGQRRRVEQRLARRRARARRPGRSARRSIASRSSPHGGSSGREQVLAERHRRSSARRGRPAHPCVKAASRGHGSRAQLVERDPCASRSGSAPGGGRGSRRRAGCRSRAAPSRACARSPRRRSRSSRGRILPDPVQRDVGVVLDAVGHVRSRAGGGSLPGPQFIHSMCDGASGIVSAMRRRPGRSSSIGACVHMLSAE